MTEARRVLCVTSNFPRWAGDSTTPFVLHLAEDLQTLGWHVDVLAPHAPDAARHESIDGVEVRRFRYLWPERQQTVCYQGGALINLRKNALNKLKLPALVGAETLAIAGRLRQGRYDLLHSHWILPQGFTGMLARRAYPVTHVLTVHGGDIFGLQGQVLAQFKRAALRNADAVTVNSSATERAVEQLAAPLARLERIPMGVSVTSPSLRHIQAARALRERLCPGKGPMLLFIGRVVEEKGVEDLLRAAADLMPTMPTARIVIVGEGQDRPAMERLTQDLGLARATRFTGWVASDEIPAYLAAADVFVGPSRTARNGWVEGQGLTFLEAMVAGTPVVATRSGGIVDAVRHEETGLLVEERAPQQIAAAIQRLTSQPDLARRLAVRAQQAIAQTFSREASANRFSRLFAELVE